MQHQFTRDLTVNISYVGSQGHFVSPDSTNARGLYSNQLDPKYLGLGSKLSLPGTAANLASAGVAAPYANYNGATGSVGQALKPFPQYSGVSDPLGFVGNTRYHALQIYANQRLSHGLTFMVNYTWSRSIDNNGSFRAGYDIPAAFAMDGQFHSARSLDKSLSLGNQPHTLNATAVWDLPFGRGHALGQSTWISALVSDWKLSGIYRAYAGSPVSIVMNSCNTNPSQNVCYPVIAPGYTGNGRINGSYHDGVTAQNLGSRSFLDSKAFAKTPDYMFSTIARTAPLNINGPGYQRVDLSLRRSFPLGFEGARLSIQADMFNVANHTQFTLAQSQSWGSGTFGTLSTANNQSRDVQLAARIQF